MHKVDRCSCSETMKLNWVFYVSVKAKDLSENVVKLGALNELFQMQQCKKFHHETTVAYNSEYNICIKKNFKCCWIPNQFSRCACHFHIFAHKKEPVNVLESFAFLSKEFFFSFCNLVWWHLKKYVFCCEFGNWTLWFCSYG